MIKDPKMDATTAPDPATVSPATATVLAPATINIIASLSKFFWRGDRVEDCATETGALIEGFFLGFFWTLFVSHFKKKM